MMQKKGFFITLEGNEGCGKTTQIQLLHQFLKKKGLKVCRTREPGGTAIGDAIRSILLDAKNKKMTPIGETLLYMAARAQVAQEVIRPNLNKGLIVLCDRWLDATVAYQGYGAGVKLDWIHALGEMATGGTRPDVTLFLDLPLATGLRRAKSHKKADRMEKKELAFHRRVRAGYQTVAKKDPQRFQCIAVSPSDGVWAVHEKIKKVLKRVLPSLN